jgi:hypothetical protein
VQNLPVKQSPYPKRKNGNYDEIFLSIFFRACTDCNPGNRPGRLQRLAAVAAHSYTDITAYLDASADGDKYPLTYRNPHFDTQLNPNRHQHTAAD